MKENPTPTNPPFYVGQKVVAIRNSKQGHFKKGQIFTVLALDVCRCGVKSISIGKSNKETQCLCGKVTRDGELWKSVTNFAPLDEPRERIRYVAVSESLREKAQEVVVDSVTTN